MELTDEELDKIEPKEHNHFPGEFYEWQLCPRCVAIRNAAKEKK